jgi:hypothetical protein
MTHCAPRLGRSGQLLSLHCAHPAYRALQGAVLSIGVRLVAASLRPLRPTAPQQARGEVVKPRLRNHGRPPAETVSGPKLMAVHNHGAS